MSEKKVLLTGSEGTIGKVLTGYTIAEGSHPALDANITRLDISPQRGSDKKSTKWRGETYNRPEYIDHHNPFIRTDMHDQDMLKRLMNMQDVIIHAAWAKEGILDPSSHNPDNLQNAKKLLDAAVQLGSVASPKIVLLSSVNAHVPNDWERRRNQGDFIKVDENPLPYHHNRGSAPGPGFSRYGQSKISLEKMALGYVRNYDLDITVARIGGVNMANITSSAYAPHLAIAEDPERGRYFDLKWEDAVRLSHEDLVRGIQNVVDSEFTGGHFKLFNLVSDNAGRVHEL